MCVCLKGAGRSFDTFLSVGWKSK